MVSRTEEFGWVWLSELHLEGNYDARVSSYLSRKEMDMLQACTPRRRRHWAMGRIAAKDAVRHYFSSLGRRCPAPSKIMIASDKAGCPVATLPGGGRAYLSIAHSAGIAVAMSSDAAIGIDIERVCEHEPGMEEFTISSREKKVLAEVTGEDGATETAARCKAFLRSWTAKEAVSKAVGTGLGGRFSDFEIMDGYQEFLKVCHHPSQTHYGVRTFTLLHSAYSGSGSVEYVISWAKRDDLKDIF